MKVSRVMIIMLVLIMSVGAVCATDDISDDVISNDSQEILGVESEASFTDLTDEINNANYELNLTHDYKFNNETDNSRGIFIKQDNFVLNGNGHTIDGNNQSRIFAILGNNITINNIILTNANAKSGSILFIQSNCSLITNNVVFANSTASDNSDIYVLMNALYSSNGDKFLDLYSSIRGEINAINSLLLFFPRLCIPRKEPFSQ